MTRYFSVFLAMAILLPTNFSHAADLEVSGWIPWWQDTMGTKSATEQIDNLDIIYPFVFEVSAGGILSDEADLSEDKWQDLFEEAEDNNVKVLPSILWNDGPQIHAVLSHTLLRSIHIEMIARMVEDGDYDGVNIDYESKLASTKDYYSIFLRDLKERLDGKILTCTVEARTPPDSLWREVPAVIDYANDYEAIGQYCDRVDIMTYDQQRADLKLNDTRQGEPYIPVADTDWVEKVVDLALEDIPANKIMLGVATYGRVWNLTVAPQWYKNYDSVAALNLPAMEDLAGDYDVEIGRNEAGEASFSYFHEDSPFQILNALPVPDGTRVGFEAAAKALLFANLANMEVPVRVAWYSDAEAVAEKIDLARKYSLRGIAIFKIDGEEDQDIWDLF